ncbi:MAG: protein kinase, partial [Rudaea sp.]
EGPVRQYGPTLVLEIPGYKILRQLGRGGMATVYLATQESVQREIALKVMSPSLLTDPDFSERFQREARIAARLHHRHVVGIHDVAKSGENNYIAMEYLAGGPVLARDGGARAVPFALRITREMGLALNYAHAKGFVHRDVKPDNILLREDGSSALTDFGIARAADSATRMTRTGAVIGTPHYMSPEQARGRTVDGRADLYSLGIVLYELLIGRVPYNADDSLAVGIMHITQPIPMLPEHLSSLQPLLNRLLAKQPDERYQNGAQLADAIEQIELRIADGALPELVDAEEAYRREVPGAAPRRRDTPTTEASGAHRQTTPSQALRYRSDPALGRLDGVATTGSYRPIGRRRSDPSRRAPWGWIVAALVLLAAVGGAWRYQDRLRALIPSTELNNLVARGDKALSEGRLIGSRGDSARELFQSARSIDPDNDQARVGLTRVGERLLDDARTALQKNDLPAARADIGAAEELLGGGARVDELKSGLRGVETRGTQVDDLLRRADAALQSGKLIGEDSASALYQRVLAGDAGNALAANGIDKVAKAQAQLARDAIAQGNGDLAGQRISELAQVAPNHPSIPELRAALTQMRSAETQAQDQQIVAAEKALRDSRLSGNDGAVAQFNAILKREPANARAKAGLRKAGLAFAAQAGTQLDANNMSAADAPLRQAEALAGDSGEVRSLRGRVRELREAAAIASDQAKEPSLAERGRIEDSLAEADRALAAGSLMDPGGAYDKYRAVLRFDGNNTRALDGLKHIAPRARELFDKAVAEGKANSARGFLDAVSGTDPGNPALASMRERLAGVYLDQAESRLGQGQRGEAVRAFNAARELSPGNPRNAVIEAKLQEPPPAS